MIKISEIALLSLTSILLSSCTNIQQPRLTKDNMKSIKSTRLVLNTNQTEIMVRRNNLFNSDLPDPYSPMDNGAILTHHDGTPLTTNLLTMLIIDGTKSMQDYSNKKSISSEKKNLTEINYMSNLNANLKADLSKLHWLNLGGQEIKYNLKSDERSYLAKSKEENILFVGTTYALNSGFKQIEVAAYVELAQKTANNKDPRVLYGNNFHFEYRLPNSMKDKNTKKDFWLANNSENVTKKLKDASSLISSMIAMDMSTENLKRDNNEIITFYNVDGGKEKGRLIARKNDYYLVALDNNELYAFNADAIVT